VLFENQLAVMLRELGLRASSPAWFPGRSLAYAIVAAGLPLPRERTGTDE
jgi:hypothetical protein